MTKSSGQLVFNATPFTLTASAIFILAVVVLAFLAWKRSGWRAPIAWLELLRVLVAIAIAVVVVVT